MSVTEVTVPSARWCHILTFRRNAITLLKSIWIQSEHPKEWMATGSVSTV